MISKIKYFGLIFALFFCINSSTAQPFSFTTRALNLLDINKTIPPPPTAAQLGRYGECPVSLYTGRPSINISLYNLKIGDFELPITLSYNAGGNKVSDIASWVGLGWNLNAGGLITRTIRGMRDEIVFNGYTSNAGDSLYLNLLDGCDYDQEQGYHEFINLKDIADGIMDGQPDEYFFNFGNYSGKFIFDKDLVIRQQPNEKKIIIECVREGITNPGNSDTIISFKITTEDGAKYFFGSKFRDKTFYETVEIYANPLKMFTSTTSGNSMYPVTMFGGNQAEQYKLDNYYNSWYLYQIILPNRIDTIKFNYENDSICNITNWNDRYFYNYNLGSSSAPNTEDYWEQIVRTFSKFTIVTPRLTEIS